MSSSSESPNLKSCDSPFDSIPKGRGRLIVFEGLDRSGKTTQVSMVNDVKKMRFPSTKAKTDDPISNLIVDVLSGNDNTSGRVLHLLFCADRWKYVGVINDTLDNGIDVVVDRYSYSGIAYTLARYINETADDGFCVTDETSSTEMIHLLKWAISTEIGLPEPDIVFYFDADPYILQSRAEYGQGDIHEKVGFQTCVRDIYLTLFGALDQTNSHGDILPSENAMLFDSAKVIYIDALKSREVIHQTILSHIQK